MGFSKVFSGQTYYLKGQVIDIEVDLSRGLHSFGIVGLPDKSIDEAKDRISAAIKNSGFISPKQKNHRVIISLAPAQVRKEGSHFDLAMAIGYLLASEEINFNTAEKIFVGELSLDGMVRKVRGILSITTEAKRTGFKEIFVPIENAREASLVDGINVFGVTNLKQIVDHLIGRNKIEKISKSENLSDFFSDEKNQNDIFKNKRINLEQIVGQPLAKRGLEIAAAGGHNVMMFGPPGTGKTMLANALRFLLPKLSLEQALEVTSIHSTVGLTDNLISDPPFRSPHHTSSYTSLVGGGTIPKPGEITLAHHGILFLDEFPEFEQRVIESLRQPLEERRIHIARARGSVYFPAHFILVAAMNPCPCGNSTSKKNKCVCSENEMARYRRKVSGPILDRIDLTIEVGDIEHSDFDQPTKNLNGETERVKDRVFLARQKQMGRFEASTENLFLNSEMSGSDLSLLSNLSTEANVSLVRGAKSFNLSMRSYHRVWRVARTIADLEASPDIKEKHVLEAFQYRRKAE